MQLLTLLATKEEAQPSLKFKLDLIRETHQQGH